MKHVVNRASQSSRRLTRARSGNEPQEVLFLTIGLRHIVPLVWRKVVVPASFTFHQLHKVIQAVFEWTNSHLYQFDGAGQDLGIPNKEFELDPKDARRTRLSDLLKPPLTHFLYRYDFSDNWEHEIRIERRISLPDITHLPICFDGARAAPPDDCGGSGGYEELQKALSDPEHPEHEDLTRWMGGVELDPEFFDLADANHSLRKLRPRVPAGRRRPPAHPPQSRASAWTVGSP